MPTPVPTAHLTGGANAVAVLALPGGSPASAALHWLDGGGVPSVVAGSLDEALTHGVAVILGPVADVDVPRLQAFAAAGGVLVIERPFSASSLALAGVSMPTTASRDTLVVLPGAGLEAATVRFPGAEATAWAVDAGALARYPDGGAAIAARQIGTGAVIALGVALGDVVLASESSVVAPRVPAAGEPAVGTALGRDVFAHLGRTIYGLAAPGITLGGAPGGHAAALVLTHDIDTPAALEQAGALAELERDRGVHGTYFVAAQAHGADGAPAVLDAAGADRLRALEAAGADVQSGGVAFGDDPAVRAGDGREAVPGYAPTTGAGGASLFGEARVSRHVLAAVLPGLEPTAFRAPAAVAPPELDGAPPASSYAVDASARADVVAAAADRLTTGEAADAEQPVLRLPLRFDDRLTARRPPPRRRSRRHPGAAPSETCAPAGGTHLAGLRVGRDVRAGEPAGPASRPTSGSLNGRRVRRFWSARHALSLETEAIAGGYRARLTGTGEVRRRPSCCRSAPRAPCWRATPRRWPLAADGRRGGGAGLRRRDRDRAHRGHRAGTQGRGRTARRPTRPPPATSSPSQRVGPAAARRCADDGPRDSRGRRVSR